MYDIYLILPGDTLNSIAQKYNTARQRLRALNPNRTFSIGTNIVVPKYTNYFDTYKIDKGDTLYEIARKYNTDYNLLALLNGLNVQDYIYPNNTILVPKKDVKYYITKENDTLNKVNKLLESNLNNLLNQNNNIYLKEGQLIVYKD